MPAGPADAGAALVVVANRCFNEILRGRRDEARSTLKELESAGEGAWEDLLFHPLQESRHGKRGLSRTF